MRLIDADAIRLPKGFFEDVDNVPKFYEWLSEQHTIDPVKHGNWIRGGEGDDIWLCSECESIFNCRMKYCGNCGARMEGEEDAPD